jgi:O-antigen/teichoic acid export membrane protein
MIGILIEAISGPVGMILQARKRENQVIGLNVCVFVVFLITASILINSYGIIGAACSVSLTILIRNVVLLTMLHKTQSERCPKQT